MHGGVLVQQVMRNNWWGGVLDSFECYFILVFFSLTMYRVCLRCFDSDWAHSFRCHLFHSQIEKHVERARWRKSLQKQNKKIMNKINRVDKLVAPTVCTPITICFIASKYSSRNSCSRQMKTKQTIRWPFEFKAFVLHCAQKLNTTV